MGRYRFSIVRSLEYIELLLHATYYAAVTIIWPDVLLLHSQLMIVSIFCSPFIPFSTYKLRYLFAEPPCGDTRIQRFTVLIIIFTILLLVDGRARFFSCKMHSILLCMVKPTTMQEMIVITSIILNVRFL